MDTTRDIRRIWTAPVLVFSTLAALIALGCWIQLAQAQSDEPPPPPPPPPPNLDADHPDVDGPPPACYGDRARIRGGFDGPPPRGGEFDRPLPPPQGRYGERGFEQRRGPGARGPEGRGPQGRGGQGYGRGPYAQRGGFGDGAGFGPPPGRLEQGWGRGGFDGPPPPPRWDNDWSDGPQDRQGPPPRMGRGGFGDGPGFGPPPGRPQQGWGRGGFRSEFDGPPDGPRGPRPPDPETVFGDMDANGDQSISKDEFLKFHEEHRPPFGPPPGPPMGDRPPRPEPPR